MYSESLKTKNRQFDNFVIAGGKGNCCNDNFSVIISNQKKPPKECMSNFVDGLASKVIGDIDGLVQQRRSSSA